MAIYGLQLSVNDRLIKVGTSTNPKARISAQQRERILFIVEGDTNTEAVCHAMLAPYRKPNRLEVFEVPDRVLAALRNLGKFSGLPADQWQPDSIVPGLDF